MTEFNHVSLSELDFDLKSKTTERGREYITPENNVYPSVTTVLSDYSKQGILEWRKRVGEEEANRISRLASTRGTKVHAICENYLKNKMTPMKMSSMMPDIKSMFLQLKPKLDENIGDVYSLEQALYSDKLRLAGRVDCIAEWNGELSVIDFKTSSKEKNEDWIQNYFMQTTAYSEMFEERTGRPINQIVIAIAVAEGNSQVFVKKKDKYQTLLKEYIDNYWLTR